MPSLIQGNRVIAVGAITQDADAFIVDSAIYAKTIFGDAVIVQGEPNGDGPWYYQDSQFVKYDAPKPVIAVPSEVTPRQARIVLALKPATSGDHPHLLAQVEAAFGSLPEPEKTVARITWEYSIAVERTNPLIGQMQAIIGFTDEQIDQLFIEAAKL
jgi:hypothetical protein